MIEDLALNILDILSSTDQTPQAICDQRCKNPKVSASLLEMLPLALEIVTNNKSKEYYHLLSDQVRPCVLYQNGNCTNHSFRPLACRPANPDENIALKIKKLAPQWAEEVYPINQALKLAIDKVLFIRELGT